MPSMYLVPAKEHLVVDSLTVGEISVSKIFFCKYLEYVPIILLHLEILTTANSTRRKISSILSTQ